MYWFVTSKSSKRCKLVNNSISGRGQISGSVVSRSRSLKCQQGRQQIKNGNAMRAMSAPTIAWAIWAIRQPSGVGCGGCQRKPPRPDFRLDEGDQLVSPLPRLGAGIERVATHLRR